MSDLWRPYNTPLHLSIHLFALEAGFTEEHFPKSQQREVMKTAFWQSSFRVTSARAILVFVEKRGRMFWGLVDQTLFCFLYQVIVFICLDEDTRHVKEAVQTLKLKYWKKIFQYSFFGMLDIKSFIRNPPTVTFGESQAKRKRNEVTSVLGKNPEASRLPAVWNSSWVCYL